jgi:hypothetical protein
MKIKYAYTNPLTGKILFAESKEELLPAFATLMVDVYIQHFTDNIPFTVVETLDNGDEKWYTPAGEQIGSLVELRAAALRELELRESFRNAGAIPITTL